MLPIVLAANLIMLYVGYRNAKTNAFSQYTNVVSKAAAAATSTAEEFDLSVPAEAERCGEKLSELCNDLNIQYMYVLAIDETAKSETYLALGFHKDTPAEIVHARQIGDVVTGFVNEQQIAASHGKTEDTVVHESNEFGDTLICYLPLNESGSIVGAEKAITSVVEKLKHDYFFTVIFTLMLTVSITLAFALILHLTVSKPAKAVSRKMARFVSERTGDFEKLEINGSKEFIEMAQSFNSMADEIEQYLDDINALNKEKHTRQAELDIAKNIQNGLLPAPDASCGSAEIHAFIMPAKEIGGDLYDYYEHENGDVSLAIADVSGKGVSAALFMSRAITLLRMMRKMELSPARTLEMFNNALAEFNPRGLFITAFIARYSAADGRLTYANAGHNPPYLISDRLIRLDGACSMAAGVFPGVPYEETELPLRPGDALFLFTDGVNEAENPDGGMFSTEALEDLLRSFAGKDKGDLIRTVLGRIEAFAAGAEQSDDITMLTAQICAPKQCRLEVPAEETYLTEINAMIDGLPGLPAQTVYELKLAAEEVFVNICSYAYPDGGGTAEIGIRVSDEVELTFADSGAPFDPTRDVLRIEDYDHARATGGLGRFIAFQMAKACSYRYENGKNILSLTFEIR